MRTVIIGAGAMGCLFGGLLSEAGMHVCLLDVWREHVDALQRNGLTIEWRGRTRTIAVQATTDTASLGAADLVMVFVKSGHTDEAARTAVRLAADSGLVLTLQNGLGNADVLARAVGAGRVIAGTTSQGATLLGPGRIRHAGRGSTIIGMWGGGKFQAAFQVADWLSRSGIAAEAVEDIQPVVWNKLLVNVGINAITALTGIQNGQLLDLPQTRALSQAAAEEAAAVARACGVAVAEDVVQRVFAVARATAENRSSMGQDVDARRVTEIETINGAVVRRAVELGMPVPVNQALTALVETLQAHYGP